MAKSPLNVAIAGVGGYAGQHHASVLDLEASGECRLVATCDPTEIAGSDPDRMYRLSDRAVATYGELEDLLDHHAGNLDVVTLPTPIPLHAEQHAMAVRHGVAVYLEKPPTLWWPEFIQMTAVEQGARIQTHVGFNFVGDPMRRSIKSRIVEGEFGRVLGASLCAVWPRHRAYYGRNDWAGRQKVGGHPVMDSPIGNAMAHFVQDLLFWTGSESVDSLAVVDTVQAQLYQAHPIESFDTVFANVSLRSGKWLRIAATHTGSGTQTDREAVVCEGATIAMENCQTAVIEHRDGGIERLSSPYATHHEMNRANLSRYFAYVRGEEDRPITRLEDCVGFVRIHHLAFMSSGGVRRFHEDRISRNEQRGTVDVQGLPEELEAFASSGVWPLEPPAVLSADVLPG